MKDTITPVSSVDQTETQVSFPIPIGSYHASNQIKSVTNGINSVLGDTGAITFVDSDAFFRYVTALRKHSGIRNVIYGATSGGDNMYLHYKKAERGVGQYTSVTITYPLAINYQDIDGKRLYTATVTFSEIAREEC